MGLPMNNIHSPTVVPSGPSTDHSAANGSTNEKVPLMDLIADKTRVEEELKALGSVLDSHNVNMNTPLTTFDGYPRDDLDIAQIRTTRARIIHLRNDYKHLMSRIETGLHEHHASLAATNPPPTPSTAAPATTTSSSQHHQTAPIASHDPCLPLPPFAKVANVTPNSPADAAGLKTGDWIRTFGEVNWMNHEKLARVAEVVRREEGSGVGVKVLRIGEDVGEAEGEGNGGNREKDEELELRLVPRAGWGGRGLLGCYLVPV